MVEQGLEDLPEPAPKKPPPPREWKLQAACIKATKARQKKDPDLQFIAAQAESPRDAVRAEIAKRMGLQRGVADIILLRKTPALRMDWVELKLPDRRGHRNGGLSDEQLAWQEWFHGTPVRCWTVYTLEEFTEILDRP